MIKFLFTLVLLGILFTMLVPALLKFAVKRMIGKATQQQRQQYNDQYSGGNSQSSYSSSRQNEEEYHGSVLVHDEESARRMRRMKDEAEDVEAVIIDEPAKVKEEEKAYR